jgi:hypothetical protein
MVADSYLYTLANTTTATTPIAAYTPNVDRLEAKMKELESLFFRKVVVKCPACGQWGAALCECKYCGHPIDMGEMPSGVQAAPKEKLWTIDAIRKYNCEKIVPDHRINFITPTGLYNK